MQVFIVRNGNNTERHEQYEDKSPDIIRDSARNRIALRGKGVIQIKTARGFAKRDISIEVYLTEAEVLMAAEHVKAMQHNREEKGGQ